MSDDDLKKIVEFPNAEAPPEEHARRVTTEANRLTRLAPGEWLLWIDDSAKRLGIPRATLEVMVKEIFKQREKEAQEAKAEDRRREQRAEKQGIVARREQDRKEREQRDEQKRADREAERKRKEREKALEAIAKLPSVEHEARLVELAKRLDQDLEILRDEFAVFVGKEDSIRDIGRVEPWDEPVEAQALLFELMAQIRRYVVVHDDVAMAVSLWTMFAWVHNEIAVYSPNLVVTSAEADSGKTTLLGVLGLLTPRPYSVVEPNAANVFRIIDRAHPTFIVDEADQLFRRKPDLNHIVNAGWTRGMAKIPRMVHGVIREFDVFCPKIVGMKGLALDATTLSRSIVCKLWPKLPHEKVSDFGFTDDDAFLALRRKLARWRDDNLPALRDATPILPSGFGNRLAANWKLLLAIAELAGEGERASAAAVRLSRKRRQVSDGLRLLAALQPMRARVAKHDVLASAEIVKELVADPDGEWVDFRGRGPITQKQVATLLEEYEIFPDLLRVPGRPRTAAPVRGYRAAWFDEVFARCLPQPYNRYTPSDKATKNAGKVKQCVTDARIGGGDSWHRVHD